MTIVETELAPPLADRPRLAHTLAITSGKGGVGKTSVAVNLAISLAKVGLDVCLFDADTGLANVNIMLGLHPKQTLAQVLSGERTIDEVVLDGPMGISIVPAASGICDCGNLTPAQQRILIDSLRSLEQRFDYLIIDTAAGISDGVLHFVRAASEALVVVTPEPTSLTDAFSLIKVLKRNDYDRCLRILVNQCRDQEQAREVYLRLAGAVKKYLGLPVRYLGFLRNDESIRTSVSLQRPVALFPANDPSSRCFLRLAEALEKDLDKQDANAFSSYWQQLTTLPEITSNEEPQTPPTDGGDSPQPMPVISTADLVSIPTETATNTPQGFASLDVDQLDKHELADLIRELTAIYLARYGEEVSREHKATQYRDSATISAPITPPGNSASILAPDWVPTPPAATIAANSPALLNALVDRDRKIPLDVFLQGWQPR